MQSVQRDRPLLSVTSVHGPRIWPRANIPAKPRVAWNVAFRQILVARSAADSLTDYTRQMAPLVRRTEKVFRSLTEKWIKGKRIANADALATEINGILGAVNALSYAAPEKTPAAMTEPGRAGADDTLGALLTGVLGNLIGRLSKLEGLRATATFAGSLQGQASGHRQSGIWRTTTSAPLPDLDKLSKRLGDVSSILHEMAHDSGPNATKGLVNATRKASLGGAVGAAARHCRMRADRRFVKRLRELGNALADQGWNVRCLSRADGESDSVYWPPFEVAILVEITDFETQYAAYVEQSLSLAKQHLKNDWPYRTVPIMNDQVLASLALRPSSLMPLPDTGFSSKWSDCIGLPVFSSQLVDGFDEAMAACIQVSAIITSCGLRDLHPDEEETLAKAIDSFKDKYQMVADAAQRTGADETALALDFLDRNWNRIIDELKAGDADRTVRDPLCMTVHLALAGDETEHAGEMAAIRVLMLQAECGKATGNRTTPAPEAT